MTSAAPAITSLTNPRVKAAVRLRDRSERDATGLTLVDGAREISSGALGRVERSDRVHRALPRPDVGGTGGG